ncbi:glycosyltransferase [Lithospermum erythrorhizon]|uniref:Glycosyltransferase n=1 Tax=Lithospermum erythrorhizon TaxID=34254 RepID=A0AAV3PAN4_LITER
MAISVSKKRSKVSKRKETNSIFVFFYSFLARVFLRFPFAIFLLIVIFVYTSSTTIISGNIVHVCVTSRKLNNLYCISAGSQPGFDVPVVQQSLPEIAVLRVNDSSGSVTDGENKDIVKDVAKLLDSPSAVIENSVGKPRDGGEKKGIEVLVPPDDEGVEKQEIMKDIEVLVPPVDEGVEKKEIMKEVVDVAVNSPILPLSSTISSLTDEKKDNDAVLNDGSNVNSVDKISSILQLKDEELVYAYTDVEDQMKMHRSWISNNNHESCEGRGVYVYELPSKFNKDLVGLCGDMIPWGSLCKYFSNEALGESMPKLGERWYQTHQYSLEPIFHSRVLKHPCRVYNENEAKLFYVPYYGGLDILRWHFKDVSNEVKDSLALELIRWLETQEPWYRNGGKDHIFVLGKISWDFRRNSTSSWGTRLLEQAEMQNPIKLLIERQPWQINDIGIPHPTSFHPHTDDDIVNWQLKIIQLYRKNLVSFAGGARPDAPDNVRNVLINQCSAASNGNCKFLNCSSGGCDQQETITELFMESEFCMQPPGDSPTRKSVFDSLISGCIPVLFDPFTAFYQYPWHLPEDHKKYSVFISQEEAKKNEFNVIERLMRIPKKERDDMRRYIVYELMPGLVYADSSSKLEKFQDAFTIAMNNLLQMVTNKSNEL